MTNETSDFVIVNPTSVELTALRAVYRGPATVELGPDTIGAIKLSQQIITNILDEGRTVYGVNTGFGLLASKKIERDQLVDLQRNIVLSHSAGIGEYLPEHIVRLVMVLKVISLSQGHSGVRLEVIEGLIGLLDAEVYPGIPSKGSVGASGDLAPLSAMAGVLIGVGEVIHKGKTLSAKKGLIIAGVSPITLGPKEGLALLNGTQVSTALALAGLFGVEDAYGAAIVAGSLSVDAAKGSDTPFDQRIHEVRGQVGQIDAARVYRELLDDSEIRQSHKNCERVQDPYCLRCQPQVMGAILDNIRHAAGILLREAVAVSDNPLVFPESGDVLSGGNFHAEPVAIVADLLAICAAEIGNISERRVALLIDHNLSGLPHFLINEAGLNSGFMIAQVTAAALASENKQMSHPASVDSIPTSANQEDHVSMATHGARRLVDMAENTAGIVAIELLAAAQGVDFHRPLKTSKILEEVMSTIRLQVPFYAKDRTFTPDIEAVKLMIQNGDFWHFIRHLLPIYLEER